MKTILNDNTTWGAEAGKLNENFVEAQANLLQFNNGYNFIAEGTNLIEGIVLNPADFTEGQLNRTTGEFITATGYEITPHIPIPNGAKVRLKIGYRPITNCGLSLYKNGSYFQGVAMLDVDDFPGRVRSGNYVTFTFPENFFAYDGNYSVRICTGSGFIATYGVEMTAYADSVMGRRSTFYSLPSLNSITGNSLLKYKVYDVDGKENPQLIGSPNAITKLKLDISEKFNVRFKFRLEENVLNTGQDATIFSCNGVEINTVVTALQQMTTTYVDDAAQQKTSHHFAFTGGIRFTGQPNEYYSDQNLGDFAFAVKYAGNLANEATMQNTGSAFILKVNGATVATFDYATYTKVSELYEAIAGVDDFEVDCNELESRLCTELAIFPEVKLVSNFRTATDGETTSDDSTSPIYRDAAKFHIPYAVSNKWHTVELVSFNKYTYIVVDGNTASVTGTLKGLSREIVFGDGFKIHFKDIEIDTASTRDAELVKFYNGTIDMLISSFNPIIHIFEGHGLHAGATHEIADQAEDMNTTPDRLQRVFRGLQSRGYVPVSLFDIRDWYYNDKLLPKRCYTMMFDDWRFDNYLDLKKRSAFTRYNIKPSLCTISDRTLEITYNNEVITPHKAIEIGKEVGFSNVSHTRNHRNMTKHKPSDYESEWLADVISGDLLGINTSIITYPFGAANRYLFNVLKFFGCNLGIRTIGSQPNRRVLNPLALTRTEIGLRSPIDVVLSNIV